MRFEKPNKSLLEGWEGAFKFDADGLVLEGVSSSPFAGREGREACFAEQEDGFTDALV